MSDYFSYVIALSSLAALAAMISFSGGKDKWHRLAVSAVLVSGAVAPILSVLGEISSVELPDVYEQVPDVESGALGEAGERAFSEGIRRLVSEKWGVEEEKIIVSLEGFDLLNMRCEKIKITLLGRLAHIDFRALCEYIESEGLGECEVYYASD